MASSLQFLRKLLIVLACVVFAGLFYLNALITNTFESKRYALPAQVYARPLELFVGARLPQTAVVQELERLGYRRVDRVRDRGQYEVFGTRMRLHSRGFVFPDGREPARMATLEFSGASLAALSSAGAELDILRLEPTKMGGIYPAHGEDRILLRLDQVPDTLQSGLLAIEDRSFYSHWGFSPTGIARAALGNMRSGRVVAGGSTVTQQLVKNYYLSSERTLRRKVLELLMAVLIEVHYEKSQILESYLNEVYLGQDGPRAIHGFALAALHYFDRPLEELGLHQQALLIGMIRGPSLYNPNRNPKRARERRDLVLQVMAEQGLINQEQAVVAQAMPLSVGGARRIDSYPAYLDLVRRHLKEQYRKQDYATAGLRIFTPFDPRLQDQLERSTTRVMDMLNPAGDLQTASVVTRTVNGEVVAIVGGRKPRAAGFNRALDARRPAGSLLKPAVYLAALEQSERYTLATPLDDSPLRIAGPNGDVWAPRNFDRESHGDVLLHRALAKSYNQATARLGMDIGLPAVVDMLQRLGLRQDVPKVPSLVLGAGEYSPLMMARLYQTIAVDGTRTPLRSILSIVNREGAILRNNITEYERAVDPRAIHLLHYALREVVREGTGRGVYRSLADDFHVAGKTGTTNDGRDSWFAGFSGDLLAVTWIGRDNNDATGLTGSSGALRVWADFMAKAAGRPLSYRMPGGVELHRIDDVSGDLTGEGCQNARLLPFIVGSQPESSTGCQPRAEGIRGWFEKLFGGD
ncbi:penicillin-binding protein 1B [Congregibacter variabilis]|uniref:Penicillin-binding protein 1B n=1 Tax=Congregibacter variabilis TaxID=3081200 RepID=A0ABZ0I0I0_9GAMM|nr:penicillin-binding protein 1B [Congregibacter sp. IMCC43200]